MQNYGYPYYPSYWNNTLQQNYANQVQQMQQTQQHPIRVVLVSNEEEAKATPADTNGNPLFFYNKSMNKVYLKQINPQTGAAPLQIFNLEQPKIEDNIKTQPDEMMRYNNIMTGIEGLYRLLTPSTTQPPIMDEEKPKKAGNK